MFFESRAERATGRGSYSVFCGLALRVAVVCAVTALARSTPVANAQDYLHNFHNRNADLKQVQPSWVTPLVGTSPLLGQFVREEFVRERVAGGKTVWFVGNGKGLSLAPSLRVEVDLSLPNYVVHGAAAGTDGIGDFCFTTHYRIASGNQKHGNYAVTAILHQTWTSGTSSNGAAAPATGITLAGGKAFGRFAALGTVGGTLPGDAGLATMGRPVGVNTAFEMHVTPKVWAQMETNSTFYNGGSHDGKIQTFVTPGVFLVPFKPWSQQSKSYLLFGVGMQFATTHYHATDHNLVIDTKVYF